MNIVEKYMSETYQISAELNEIGHGFALLYVLTSDVNFLFRYIVITLTQPLIVIWFKHK